MSKATAREDLWVYSLPDDYRVIVEERILRRSKPTPGGCRIWQGALDKRSGYGVMGLYYGEPRTKKTIGPHRAIWLASVGEIPYGHVIDHLCQMPPCVNVEHMEAVTHQVNTYRGFGRERQKGPDDCFCRYHEREAGRAIWDTDHWRWWCQICNLLNMRRINAIKKEERRKAREQAEVGR